ncbi:MAG: hypothetical protein IKX65_06150 [Prevotella sp.]|nr:hypothetical protein [Prevotella sp.]
MYHHSRNHQEEENKDRFLMLRQVLNIIFMLGAVVGVLLYFYQNKTMGTVVIVVAMVFKMVECVLRLLK